MRPFPIEELVDRCGSRFTVVVAAAKRAKQIKEGAPPLVNLPTRNPLTIALHEIAAGLVEITEEPVYEETPVVATGAEAGVGELAAPGAVEDLLGKSIVEEVDLASILDDDVETEFEEEPAEDLEEDLEEDLDDDDEDLEDIEIDDDEDWEDDEE